MTNLCFDQFEPHLSQGFLKSAEIPEKAGQDIEICLIIVFILHVKHINIQVRSLLLVQKESTSVLVIFPLILSHMML